MPQRAKLLYMLQRIDTGLALKKRRYQQVRDSLGESEHLRTARTARDEAQETLSHLRAALRDLELETASVASKLQENKERLYGGRVTNPRELSDLQKESEYLERRQKDMEDKQIEAMMAVEQSTTSVAVTNEEYVVVEAAWRTENADLSQEYDTLRRELAQLLNQRKKVVKHISAKDMDEYNALRRLRKGVAVVAVKGGMCQVCHVQVPQRDLEKATQTDQIMYCSGCDRIMYVPQE